MFNKTNENTFTFFSWVILCSGFAFIASPQAARTTIEFLTEIPARDVPIYLILGQYQKNDPVVTATSITPFWEPVKVLSVFEISISADGFPRRSTRVLSKQVQYKLEGLLPETTYNVSVLFLKPLNSSSPLSNGPFLIYNASITTRRIGKSTVYH